jgi:Protein of unknown function (DUF5672)
MSYWPNFYKAFERYEFFLNCHLDALVLKRAFPRSRVVSWPLERWRESENPGPWATTMICSGHSPRAGISHRLRVATVEDALQFSFETCPRECFEMNGRRLPFGCHAWEYDRAFLGTPPVDRACVARRWVGLFVRMDGFHVGLFFVRRRPPRRASLSGQQSILASRMFT